MKVWRNMRNGAGLLAMVLTLVGCDAPQQTVSVASRGVGFVQGDAMAASAEAPLGRSAQFFRGTVIASDPSIVPRSGGFDVYYTDLDVSTNRTVIAKATSTDGMAWTTGWESQGIGGLVIAGRSGEWDENVESAAVARVGSEWVLFFSGYRDAGTPFKGFPAALWKATSTDGQTFARVQSAPVMEPTRGWYDNDAIYSPSVLFEDGKFHMIYVGHAYTDTSLIGAGGVFLLHATSTDGVAWVKDPEPVARPGQFADWRAEGLAEPWLLRRGPGDYLLFYTGLRGEERAIGLATGPSVTGPWDFGSRSLIAPGPRGNPDDHQVLAPAATVSGDDLRLWYLAADRGSMLTIGHAAGSLRAVIAHSR